jgi:hypothetical protein
MTVISVWERKKEKKKWVKKEACRAMATTEFVTGNRAAVSNLDHDDDNDDKDDE